MLLICDSENHKQTPDDEDDDFASCQQSPAPPVLGVSDQRRVFRCFRCDGAENQRAARQTEYAAGDRRTAAIPVRWTRRAQHGN